MNGAQSIEWGQEDRGCALTAMEPDVTTLEEIAELAGVSRSTVSRVVNGDPRVSTAARERVEAVITERHYVPNAAARSLASRRTRIIGLLISPSVGVILSDPFFTDLIQGAVRAGNDSEYILTILMETGDSPKSADRIYRRFIRSRHVDGVVILSSVVEDPIVERLKGDNFPFVLIGRHPHHAVNFVDIDNRSAAREAVAHLLEHGYRRIGIINGPPNMIASIDRYAGYVNALQEAGRIPDPSLMVYSDFTRRGAYRAMSHMLGQLDAPPDAMFVASDTMASGALQALRDQGLRVPDDVAVMGFDGLDETLVSQPILSTVHQPIRELGAEGVLALIELLEHPENAPIHRYLPFRLQTRRSCGCVESANIVLANTTGGAAA
jgi:LacI family transcriptional regulator